jgi:uncharacterized protein (DUF1501 family)
MKTTRRTFLASSLATTAVVSFSSSVPAFLQQASTLANETGEQRVLVVIQLSGGNDGLNTVVPFKQPEYRGMRPTLALGPDQVLRINDELGLHPSLAGFHGLLEDGQLAIVQGTGYPNPNRSHFESMDIWHTCKRKTEQRNEGWLGRYAGIQASPARGDASVSSGEIPAVHLGREQQPLALASEAVVVPSIRSLDQFRLQGNTPESVRASVESLLRKKPAGNDALLDFVTSSTRSALDASKQVEQSTRNTSSGTSYPSTRLAEKLRIVASLLDSPLETRIYYVTIDGFDTHGQQAGAHASLLGQLDGAVSAFFEDITSRGQSSRVLMMCFSEFGRRLKENASKGTDHGAAAPMFLLGDNVKPGIHGALPSLTDLDQGDLKHHTDFRQVYATVLEEWMQTASQPLLGAGFPILPLLRA